MKKNLIFSLVLSLFVFFSCREEDEPTQMNLEYSITINSPDATDKHVGNQIHLHVDFVEKNGGTVHHVKVRIFNKDDGTEIYNEPSVAHVHEESGKHEHHDDVTLNVDGHTDWVVEAKVWGHTAGAHEVIKQMEFHVHP